MGADNVTKHVMSDIHILLDVLRMWLLVRIYKNAYRKEGKPQIYVYLLLLFQAKYKFIGVTRQFNDCFMVVFCLFAILAWQNRHLVLSTILFAVAVNIKMSALLIIPGYLLTIAFEAGIVRALLSLAAIIGLQIAFGLEFILTNKEAYFSMSYNFERVFLKVEQVNF